MSVIDKVLPDSPIFASARALLLDRGFDHEFLDQFRLDPVILGTTILDSAILDPVILSQHCRG